MRALAAACAGAGLELLLTVRLEDGRQRHHLDVAAQLIGANVRAAVRSHPDVKLLVTNADRGFIEEVHFGSTSEEAARIRWDIAWLGVADYQWGRSARSGAIACRHALPVSPAARGGADQARAHRVASAPRSKKAFPRRGMRC